MICKVCNTDNPDGVKFCTECGAPMPADAVPSSPTALPDAAAPADLPEPTPAEPSPENPETSASAHGKNRQRRRGFRRALVTAGGVAVLLILLTGLVLLLWHIFFPAAQPVPGTELLYLSDATADGEQILRILADSVMLSDTIPGTLASSAESLDGRIGAVLTDDRVLYYISRNSVFKIAEEVQSYVMSAAGGAVAYLDAYDTLYLYTTGITATRQKIADAVSDDVFCLSPDGKSLLYCQKDANGSEELWFYTKKNAIRLGTGLYPIGLSNGGKCIYAHNGRDSHSVYALTKKGEQITLASHVEESTCLLNRDHTQLFFVAGGLGCLSVNGGEKQVLFEGCALMAPVLPTHTAVQNAASADTLPIGSFLDRLYTVVVLTSGNAKEEEITPSGLRMDLYLIDRSGTAERVDTGLDEAPTVSKNERILYYCKDRSLYRVDSRHLDTTAELAHDITYYGMTPSGRGAYYLDEAGTLYYRRATGKERIVAEHVTSAAVTRKDILLYTVAGDAALSVYTCKNGKSPIHLTDAGQDIGTGRTAAYVVTYTAEEKWQLLVSNGSSDFAAVIPAPTVCPVRSRITNPWTPMTSDE